jgi:hypothetical protein
MWCEVEIRTRLAAQLGFIGDVSEMMAMDFIQYDPLATEAVQEALRVEQHPADAGQFAVEILDARKVLTQAGFPYSTDPSQPDYGSLPPCPFKQFQPEMSMYHMKAHLQIVAPNASMPAEASYVFPLREQLLPAGIASPRSEISGGSLAWRGESKRMRYLPNGLLHSMTRSSWKQRWWVRSLRYTCSPFPAPRGAPD